MQRAIAYNVGPRRWRKIVRALAGIRRIRGAKVVGLFEASSPYLVRALRVRYPHKRVICRGSDVVAMVSRLKRRPHIEVISHDVSWRGPHMGRAKVGRKWLLLVWDDEAILLVHRVTPIGNERAWDAETELIRAITKRPDLPDDLAIIGDHNGTHERLADDYRSMGLTLLPVQAKVDQCAVRGFKGEGKRLGNHGSDHVAIEWRLR